MLGYLSSKEEVSCTTWMDMPAPREVSARRDVKSTRWTPSADVASERWVRTMTNENTKPCAQA